MIASLTKWVIGRLSLTFSWYSRGIRSSLTLGLYITPPSWGNKKALHPLGGSNGRDTSVELLRYETAHDDNLSSALLSGQRDIYDRNYVT